MGTRVGIAEWSGGLVEGSGRVELASSEAATFEYALATRSAERAAQTSPEELLAAAYASCLAMQLSALLGADQGSGSMLHVEAVVTQGGPEVDFGIVDIAVTIRGRGVSMSDDEFVDAATTASSICPIGRALASVPRTVDAALQG